jgi:hypothetical protein
MTILKNTIRRELPLMIDRRQWIVEIHPRHIEFREKGRRTRYTVPWESVWRRAMEIAAARIREERNIKRR